MQVCTHTIPPTSDVATSILPYREWLRASPSSRPIFQRSLCGGVSQSSPHPTTNPVRDDGTLRTPPVTVVDATQESLVEGLQIPTNPGLGDTVIKTYADTSVPRDIPIIAKDNLESTANNKENLCPSILENAIPTITVPINEPSLENLEESTPYLPAQSDLFLS